MFLQPCALNKTEIALNQEFLPAPRNFAISERLRTLCSINSQLGKSLITSLDQSLGEYLDNTIPREKLKLESHSAKMVLSAIKSLLVERGEGNMYAVVEESLKAYPVIQQADHSGLLLNEETLLNNLLFNMAMHRVQAPAMLTMQCDVVKCFSRLEPLGGPAILQIDGSSFPIFHGSKSRFKTTSIVGLGPVTIGLASVSNDQRHITLPTVLRRFQGMDFQRATDAFRAMNDAVWAGLKMPNKIPLVLFDESLTSRIIQHHLKSGEGPMYRLFANTDRLAELIKTKDELLASPLNLTLNIHRPDLFMYKRGGMATSARIDFSNTTPTLVDAKSGKSLGISARPENLARALHDGSILPDQFLGYCARSLLPEIVAIGGTSQQDYMVVFKHTLLKADSSASFLSKEERASLTAFQSSRLGGAALIESTPELRQQFAGIQQHLCTTSLQGVLLQSTIRELVGNVSRAEYFDDLILRYRQKWGQEAQIPHVI